MEDIDIVDVFRRYWRVMVALILVTTLVGYGISFLIPKYYTATALVLVRPQTVIKLDTKSTSREFLDFPMGSAAVETPSKTYIEIIKSPDFVGQLVRKLDLDKREETKPGFLSKFLPGFMLSIVEELKEFVKASGTFLRYGRVIPEDRFAEAVKSVQESLVLEARTDTYIFTIAYTAKDAQLAADVANGAAKLFVAYMENARQAESNYAIDKLRAQVAQSRQHLELSRERLEAFKKQHSIFRYETEYDSSLKIIAEQETELAKVDASLASLGAVANQNSASTQSLLAKRASILRTLQERKAELVPLPAMERELKILELTEKGALIAYDAVNSKYNEAEINNFNAAREVQPVADAVPRDVPSSPNQPIFALVSLLAGMVVAAGVAFLLEFMNRRVRSIRDVEEFVGIKVLATIPRVSLEPLMPRQRASTVSGITVRR